MPSLSAVPFRKSSSIAPSAGDRPHLFAVSGAVTAEAGAQSIVLWLVLRGQARVQAREGDFALGTGEWILLDGDSAPRCESHAGALLLGAGMTGNAAMLLPGRGRMPTRTRATALRLWRRHGAFDGGPAVAAASEDVIAFLSELQAELAGNIDRCPGHSPQHKRGVLRRMQRARLYLEGQPDGGLSIGELARSTHFSPWYFSKVFHALYGIAPLQFAVRMRLERARRLLATTRLSVTDVSAACGFDNPCSFARAFHSRFGMSASQCRVAAMTEIRP